MRILMTGATGNLGRKLRSHFSRNADMDVRAICLNRSGDEDVVTADLSVYDTAWVDNFAGVDTVIHLAGDPRPSADWASIQKNNIDLTGNVFAAAQRHGVGRIVFASSNWVMAGYRFTDDRLTPGLEPRPINAYGNSKLFGERLGALLWQTSGICFVGLRIGYCQRAAGNRPGPHMGYGLWGQQMWLGDHDLCDGFERAVLAPDVGFSILNLMSDNSHMRWNLEETRRVIGYVPSQSSVPKETEATREADRRAREELTRLGLLTKALSTSTG